MAERVFHHPYFKKISEGQIPVVVFPGIGQSEKYYQILFEGFDASVFVLDYKKLIENTTKKHEFSSFFAELNKLYAVPVYLVCYSFGARPLFKTLLNLSFKLDYHKEILAVAPDAFCPNFWYNILTTPLINKICRSLVKSKLIKSLTQKILVFFGFSPKTLNQVLSVYSLETILKIWMLWPKRIILLDSSIKWPFRVQCIAGSQDILFKVSCFEKLSRNSAESFIFTKLDNEGHFISPLKVKPFLVKLLRKHEKQKDKNVKPQGGKEVPE